MLSYMRKFSLPRQLGLGTFIFVLAIFVALMFIINQLFSNEINRIVTSHQQKEVELVAEQLTAKYDFLRRLAQRNGNLINNELKGLQIDTQNTVSTQGRQVPTLRLHGQIINGDSPTIENFAQAAELGIGLLYQQNSDFIHIASSSNEAGEQTLTGQILDSSSKAYQALSQGSNYTGAIQIGGQSYFAHYASVDHAPGLYYEILIPYSAIVSPLAKSLNGVTFGKSGYIYVTDAGVDKGRLILHPSLTGKNLFDIAPNLNPTFEKMFDTNSGQITYNLQVQGHDT